MHAEFPVLIPHGRSKNKSFADTREPRILLWNEDSYAPCFFGYIPKLDEIEALCWDFSTQSTSFMVAENISQGAILKPAVDCTSCHMASTAILSSGPHSEMSQAWGAINRIALQTLEAKGSLVFSELNLLPSLTDLDITEYLSTNKLDTKRNLNEADKSSLIGFLKTQNDKSTQSFVGHLDVRVRDFNYRLQAKKILNFLCEADIECRKFLIDTALYLSPLDSPFWQNATFENQDSFFKDKFYFFFKSNGLANLTLDKLKSVVSNRWSSIGFSYPSGALLNYQTTNDGFAAKSIRGEFEYLHNPNFFEPTASYPASYWSDRGYDIEDLHFDKIEGSAADPNSPRERILPISKEQGPYYLYFNLASAFDFMGQSVPQKIAHILRSIRSDDSSSQALMNNYREQVVSAAAQLSWPPNGAAIAEIAVRTLSQSQDLKNQVDRKILEQLMLYYADLQIDPGHPNQTKKDFALLNKSFIEQQPHSAANESANKKRQILATSSSKVSTQNPASATKQVNDVTTQKVDDTFLNRMHVSLTEWKRYNNIVTQKCLNCHGENVALSLPIFDPQKFYNYKYDSSKGKAKVVEYLETNRMPAPPLSITQEDRDFLIDILLRQKN
ncbi:MAG: hypothetical protein COT74_08830 [Bdellovibrionales bacterium CG10_big_fil_rev_8_21_14_0_10_45_34]|nr:MAG: hypothetical protein COT74_08830 [Bdellovibrionales bacterium CG10_big_fil_rev_8_21_14_0_10_45_34]